MSQPPIPFPPLAEDENDDDSVPESFRLRLRQLLADPTLSQVEIARRMSQFLEEQPPPPVPPAQAPTPINPCQSLPNPANPPHSPATQIWQIKPNFPPPNTANRCQPPPTRPKSNPISNPLAPQRPTPLAASPPRRVAASSSPSPSPRPLTPQQLRAIHLLRAGHPTAVIAHTLHINRHTLSTWKRLPQFQQELQRQIAQEQTPHLPLNPEP